MKLASGKKYTTKDNTIPVKSGSGFSGFISGARNYLKRWKLIGICSKTRMEEIHHANEQIRNHIENSPLAMIEWDQNFVIKRWSKIAEEMFGWKSSEVLNNESLIWHFVHEDDKERVSSELMTILRENEPKHVIYNRNYNKKGEVLHCVWYNSVLRNNSGKIVSILSLANDITLQKSTERKLQESEARYRSLIDITQEAIFINQNNRMVYVNPASLVLFGVKDAEEILGRPTVELFHKDSQDHIRERIKKLLNGEKVPVVEHKLTRPDGTTIDVEVTGTLFSFNDEPALHVVARDITTRKKAEAELRENESLLRIAGNLANLGGYKIDIANGKLIWSEQVAKIHEMPPDFSPEINDGINFYAPEYREKIVKAISRCIAEGVSLDEECQIITGKGNRVWVRTVGVAERDVSGKITGVIGGFQDISERKNTEESLKDALEKAEHSDKLKTAFLNNLSHEIRTPLNAIVGFSAFISEPGQTTEQINKIADIIQSSSDQLLGIIEDIINISTIQTGQVEVNESENNIGRLLTKVTDRFREKAEQKGLQLNCSANMDESDLLVKIDGSKLISVLYHLVDNAIKFTDKGRIDVGCSLDGEFLMINVSDTGIGVDPSYGEIIFERFFQAEAVTNRIRGGLGVGLPICKSFIDAMGGKISYESGDIPGTRFNIKIPWKPVNKKQPVNFRNRSNGTGRRKVLVAEDERSNYMLIEDILADMELELLHAWNGQEAVELVKKHPDIELVLMDIKMPVMGGYEATKLIRKEQPFLPIIAITAHAIMGDREKAINAGCAEYLSKPYPIDTLINYIYKYMPGIRKIAV